MAKLVIVIDADELVGQLGELDADKLKRRSVVWAAVNAAGEVETFKTRTRISGNTLDSVCKAVRESLDAK